MKRIVCISIALLSMVLLALFLVSCNKEIENNIPSFVVGTSSSAFDPDKPIDESIKRDWWSGSVYINENVQESLTYSFDNKEYQLSYKYSERFLGSPKEVNVFGNQDVEVALWADSGEFDSINFNLYCDEYFQKPKIASGREFAEEYARNLASKYIDISKYEIKVVTDFEGEDTERYNVFFTKYVDGYETIERAAIAITAQGDLKSLCVDYPGLFSDFDRELPTKEEVNESISTTLAAIYKDSVYEKYKCEIAEIKQQMLTYSPDGDLVILTTVSIKLSKKGCEDIKASYRFATVIE